MGYYVLSDCAQDVALPQDCKKDLVVTIWQTMMYMLMWGQDRVQTMYLEGMQNHVPKPNSARVDAVWKFFNRYAGARATNGKNYEGAWASLNVGLDAADKERFPAAPFGDGCDGIIAAHKDMGARQDDKSIGPSARMNGRGRQGMNDMYFAVTGDVFADTKAETLNMRIVYYDKGSGGFSLQYGSGCKDEQKFTKHNSGLWKEARLQIPTTSLAKGCQRNADFVLHNTDKEDDAFAFVEVSARDLIPLITTESNDLTSVLV